MAFIHDTPSEKAGIVLLTVLVAVPARLTPGALTGGAAFANGFKTAGPPSRPPELFGAGPAVETQTVATDIVDCNAGEYVSYVTDIEHQRDVSPVVMERVHRMSFHNHCETSSLVL